MHWNIKFPIGRLISERADALGLRRPALVAAMGYRNLSKGIRVLERFLEGEALSPEKAASLRELLGIPATDWEAAVANTRRERAERAESAARERFRPYIHVETNGESQHPWFVRALTYGERILAVPPDVLALPLPEQARRVGRIVAEHFAAHRGDLPTHGRIVGYTFHSTFDHAIGYAPDGTVRQPFADPSEESRPQLMVKGKVIPAGLFDPRGDGS